MIPVSLLICTRNRSLSLGRTLASITRAARTFAAIEVVIVDNGSTDDTPVCLAEWQARQPFPVTVVAEPRAGLARARNAGLAKATGRIVAMTDDDCVLDPGFFAMLVARFAGIAGPVVIGGRILLGDPADWPVTIKLEDHAMVLDGNEFPGGFVMGANLAFTRDVVDKVGVFDERFGSGSRFLAAEDTDFLFRALGCGIPVRYDPHFVVSHHHGRRTSSDLRTLMAGYAYGDGALYAKHREDDRIFRIIWQDILAAIADIHQEPGAFLGIQDFRLFRLFHVVMGYDAYLESM